MVPLLKTSHMEDAVLALDREHERVMVRAVHYVANPIRLRVKKLEEIRPFYARNAPEFDSEIAAWKEENGTLVNYRPAFRKEQVLPHNAALICELPLSMDMVEVETRDTSDLCVVYRPPTWREHEELLFNRHPGGTACKRFMQEVAGLRPTKEHAEIAVITGIPTAGTRAIEDAALEESFPDLSSLRKRTLRSAAGRQFSVITPLIPRIEPEDHTLMPLYRFIKEELPSHGGVKLARDNVLSKAMRFWKIGLRALVRSGSVEQKGKIGFYGVGGFGIAPDYVRLQAEHDAAKGKLNRLIEAVDALPEFQGRSSPQSAAPEQPESAAPRGDKAR